MSRRIGFSAVAAVALLVWAASASAAVTQLGTPPWKECGGLFQAGSGGCVASEPMAMDDTSVGNVNISPHVIRAGETLTISAEWLPGWAITGFNFPPGEVVSGCGAGDHSCTVKINGTTGGYVRHQLNFCCFNAREQDYYAVTPPDEYTIEGTVMDRVGPRSELQPAAFTGVTATIDGDVYPGTTNKKGQYAIQVEAGSGTVRTEGKQCVKAQLPKCVTSKDVTVGPNQTVDFEAPPPGKVKGVVKDAEGNAVQGTTIRADDPEGGRLDTAVSDAKGLYELSVRAGDVHLSADDPQACAISGELCPKTKDITVEANDTATQDWRVEGCVKKVDFGTSMVAVRGCFKKIADEEWETDEKFTLDGIDIYPGQKVTLDKQARRVSFGGMEAKIGGKTILKLPSLDLDFPTSETAVALPSIGVELLGFGISGNLALKLESGKTTFTVESELNTGLGGTAELGKCKGKAAAVVGLVVNNDDGLRSASFEAKDLKKIFCLPGLGEAKLLPIDAIKGNYDFKTGWWGVGGTIVDLPPFLGKLDSLKTTGEINFDKNWDIRGGSLSVKGFNTLLEPPAFYLQSLGAKFGQTNEGEPFKAEVSLGASLGPKLPGGAIKQKIPLLGEFVLKPEEFASLEATFGGSVAESKEKPASLEDLTLSGSAKAKFWDQQVLNGTAKLIFPSASFALSGALDFKAGNVLSLHGDGKSWIDTVNGVFFAEGFGEVRVLGWRGAQGNFLLNSAAPIVVGCLRSPGGVEAGVTYNFKAEAPKIGGCTLSPYRPVAPAGASSANASKAKAAKSRPFRVPKGMPLLAVEVPGSGPSGAPVVKVRGPGVSFTTDAIKPSEAKFVRALPNGAAETTYLLFTAPKPGLWRVTAQKGSSVGALRFARPAPEPVISATTSGSACGPRLRWSLKPQAGQQVMLVDQGAEGDARVLVKAAKAKGSLALTPPAPGVRTVRAIVLQGGGLRETIPLATYGGPGAPSGLSVKRAKGGLTVSWRASCGVTSYAVAVGKGKPKIVNGTSLTIAKPPKKATVTVTSLVGGTAAGAASRPLSPGTF